jgi:hypothetical protein
MDQHCWSDFTYFLLFIIDLGIIIKERDYMTLSEMYEMYKEDGYNTGVNQIIDNMIMKKLTNEEISSYTGKPEDYIENRRKILKSTTVV